MGLVSRRNATAVARSGVAQAKVTRAATSATGRRLKRAISGEGKKGPNNSGQTGKRKKKGFLVCRFGHHRSNRSLFKGLGS